MTATTARPPQTGLALYWAIPLPVRLALRARVPLHCEEHGGGESLIVSVGSGAPLRWLAVAADSAGALRVRLWEVRQKTKELASRTTTADRLPAELLALAKEFGLGN